MPIVAICVTGAITLLSTPYWLPKIITAVREWIFTSVNGKEGIAAPGEAIPVSQFRRVYSHPAANGRSKGAALSDLFWYWLSPGAEIHQEHLEPGERYEEVARTTRQFLAIPSKQAEEMAAQCVARVCKQRSFRESKLVRLRDEMMPIWAEFYYELVFGERCPPEARELIVGNANDVVTALKCCSLRHMSKRNSLTEYLTLKIRQGTLTHPLPKSLKPEEYPFYLQGVFFNTAIVQMSEGMSHLLLALAQHQEIQKQLLENLEDDRYFDRVIAETLRRYPLFGIAHRITTDEIPVEGHAPIPKGSVVCFNYLDYQKTGFKDPDRFDPDRWVALAGKETTYIPFGVTGNRPCPAQAIALITMRAAGREFLRRYACYSSASHTRSIPNRAPCLLERRDWEQSTLRRLSLLTYLRIRDRVEDVGRSLQQLVYGCIMILHARKLRLSDNYFDSKQCPVVHQVQN